jgi:archaellum component FlaC
MTIEQPFSLEEMYATEERLEHVEKRLKKLCRISEGVSGALDTSAQELERLRHELAVRRTCCGPLDVKRTRMEIVD